MADPNLVSWCEPDFVYTIFVLYFRHTQICFIFKAKPNWILKISKLNLDFDQVTPLRLPFKIIKKGGLSWAWPKLLPYILDSFYYQTEEPPFKKKKKTERPIGIDKSVCECNQTCITSPHLIPVPWYPNMQGQS